MNTAVRNSLPEDRLVDDSSDPAANKWSTVEILLSVLIDEMRTWQWVYIQAHSDRSVPRPTPIRRPGSGVRARKALTLVAAQTLDPRLRGLSAEAAQLALDQMTGGRKRGEW